MAVLALTTSVVLFGCTSGDGGASPDAGAAPDASAGVACDVPIADCAFGLFFGSCGTSAAPILACSETSGRCKWFTGGCPVGYRASDCAIGDFCCHATPDGAWPFDATGSFSSMAEVELASDLAAMGQSLVDKSVPAELAVTVDPLIGPPSSNVVTCSTATPLQVCQDGVVLARGAWATDSSLVIRLVGRGLLAEALLLELVPAHGAPIARLFVRDEEDSAEPSPTRCLPFKPQFVSGTLRVSTIDISTPEAVHGALEANLEGGHTVAVAF